MEEQPDGKRPRGFRAHYLDSPETAATCHQPFTIRAARNGRAHRGRRIDGSPVFNGSMGLWESVVHRRTGYRLNQQWC